MTSRGTHRFRRAVERALGVLAVACARGRARLLRLRGAAIGAKSAIGAGVTVERPWGVSIGQRFVAESGVHFKLADDAAQVIVGDYTFVGRGTALDVLQVVTIGSHTVIAPDCFITDHNHGLSRDRRIDQQPCVAKPIAIGNDVWLGTKAVVLAGVQIGDGAVVAAGSVVTRDVPPMTIVAGVPARVVRSRT
jgi:acetyltransferase-like isoleucine patch superfamily enzyme